jgi:Methyltransferase domain
MISAPDADNVGDYLISSRSFAEYEAMFMLRESDLQGRLLDCPGGASSFTAHTSALGAVVTAVDPVYAVPVPVLQELVQGESDRGSAHTAAGIDRYRWEFYGDLEGHREMRKHSAAIFARDIEEHPERYVAASLPDLPFEDGQFDLVLSSHFLFTYADRLDRDFHYAALLELHRISRREVRIFPLLDQAGRPLDDLIGAVLGRLTGQGIEARVLEVPYEFQRGGNEMLVMPAHPFRGATIADNAGE